MNAVQYFIKVFHFPDKDFSVGDGFGPWEVRSVLLDIDLRLSIKRKPISIQTTVHLVSKLEHRYKLIN